MTNNESSVLLPVRVVRVQENDKSLLLTHLSKELYEIKLDQAASELTAPGNEMYTVFSSNQTEPLGFIVVSDYARMNKTKEIMLHCREEVENVELCRNILQQLIGMISENKETEYIILKIRDTLKNLVQAAESIGFMKDGIFISNQFLKGEFTFYSVYQYKLI